MKSLFKLSYIIITSHSLTYPFAKYCKLQIQEHGKINNYYLKNTLHKNVSKIKFLNSVKGLPNQTKLKRN